MINYPADCSGPGLKLNMTRGVIWIYGAPGHSMYNHARPPNDPGVDCRGGLPHSSDTNFFWDRLSHNVTAHSRHPGGVQALRCDGRCIFVKNSINSRGLELPSGAGTARRSSRVTRSDPGDSRGTERAVPEPERRRTT